jgi:hypothetical protein
MTSLLDAPEAPPGTGPRSRRRVFSLNGLAIQLAALALSFTLVALLVVSGSAAAFVEPSEALAEYIAGRAAEPDDGDPPWTPVSPATPTATPPQALATPAPAEDLAEPATTIELEDSDVGTALFGAGTVLVPGVPLLRRSLPGGDCQTPARGAACWSTAICSRCT